MRRFIVSLPLALPAILMAGALRAQEAIEEAVPGTAHETAEHGIISLRNPEFIVALAFLLFLGLLAYFGVPKQVTGLLDKRSAGIRDELAQARALRDEAQALVASFDRKRQEMTAQAARIVEDARTESERAAAEAREDAARSVARRLASAEEQIASAEARALREVRDRAVTLAVAAAQDVLARQMTEADSDRLIEQSIETVGRRLH